MSTAAETLATEHALNLDQYWMPFTHNQRFKKRPKLVEFRDELPKTNVGKILRRALRE